MDRLGVYLYVQRLGQAGEVVRVAFLRPVADERDARSSLTLMAQLAWERERSYVPVPPLPPPEFSLLRLSCLHSMDFMHSWPEVSVVKLQLLNWLVSC